MPGPTQVCFLTLIPGSPGVGAGVQPLLGAGTGRDLGATCAYSHLRKSLEEEGKPIRVETPPGSCSCSLNGALRESTSGSQVECQQVSGLRSNSLSQTQLLWCTLQGPAHNIQYRG